MSDTKISDMPALGAGMPNADIIPIIDDGLNVTVTKGELLTAASMEGIGFQGPSSTSISISSGGTIQSTCAVGQQNVMSSNSGSLGAYSDGSITISSAGTGSSDVFVSNGNGSNPASLRVYAGGGMAMTCASGATLAIGGPFTSALTFDNGGDATLHSHTSKTVQMTGNGSAIGINTNGSITLTAVSTGTAQIAANSGSITIDSSGNITLAPASSLVMNGATFTPGTAGDWQASPPTSLQNAIDRIAAVLSANSMKP